MMKPRNRLTLDPWGMKNEKRGAPGFRWLLNISIAKKLYFTIGIMSILIVIELLTLHISLSTLSGVRSSIEGAGYWSKYQKDAIFSILRFCYSGDEDSLKEFNAFLEIHEGDKLALDELGKERVDRQVMREGFIKGGLHPDDVEGVSDLFIRFQKVSYLEKAIGLFYEADALVESFKASAIKLKAIILESDQSSEDEILPILGEISRLNREFTRVEQDFSSTLSKGARFLEGLVLGIVFTIALTVELAGILMAFTVSRGISRGVDEIIRTSEEISGGNYEARAKVYSKDEIGELASSFNLMTEEVARRNEELEQFAYVASHDLQEPLNTISNFVGLLDRKPHDEESRMYMGHVLKATSTMQTLILDLSELARIGEDVGFERVCCREILEEVLSDLQIEIEEAKAKISVESMPRVWANRACLAGLFRNLLSNAIKFRQPGVNPVITVSADGDGTHHTFSIRDNGIGIEEKFLERIFVAFQRLHTPSEFGGTGVGLAICKKIVDLHNGKIWVDSIPGEGSNFQFTLEKSG